MKKIVIIPNITRDPDYHYTEMAERILAEKGFETCRCETCLDPVSERAIFENAHAILVLGGDGTILNASHASAQFNVPILAVNLGRLGYIAQLEKGSLDRIGDILLSDFLVDERSMLSVTLLRNQTPIIEDYDVLNDAVIGKHNGCGMIEFVLLANGTTVSHYRGDGIILATATGSTAYSMSAGGSVIDPSLAIIEATPLAAHSLKARPIIFSKRHNLEILIKPSYSKAALTLDGETTISLQTEDRILVKVSPNVTKMISHQNDFCRILYQKMSDL